MENGPTFKEMFVNLSGAALDTFNTLKDKGVIFADEKTFNTRADICSACPHIINTMGINRCNLCGCGLMLKVRLTSSSCPINKWSRMTNEEIDRMKMPPAGHG